MADLGVWPYATMSGLLGAIAIVAVVREFQIRRETSRVNSEKGKQFIMAHNPTSDVEDGSTRSAYADARAPPRPGMESSSEGSSSADDLKGHRA